MNLTIMTIPEDPAALSGWLEHQLVGLELGQLVAELTAVHGKQTPERSLQNLLGKYYTQVLAHGLRDLPHSILSELLRHPAYLLELQERVLVEGGPYWQSLASQGQVEALVEKGLGRLDAFLHSASPFKEPAVLSTALRWWQRPALVSLATAAAVLLAVYLFRPGPSVQSAWGWNKPGALAEDVSPRAYLDRLAEGAEAWFKKRPEDRANLARRILEFRQGCNTLILAKHSALAEPDRQWLRERCRAWAAKFDQHVVALEAGADPLDVRSAMDAATRQLMEALRQRQPA